MCTPVEWSVSEVTSLPDEVLTARLSSRVYSNPKWEFSTAARKLRNYTESLSPKPAGVTRTKVHKQRSTTAQWVNCCALHRKEPHNGPNTFSVNVFTGCFFFLWSVCAKVYSQHIFCKKKVNMVYKIQKVQRQSAAQNLSHNQDHINSSNCRVKEYLFEMLPGQRSVFSGE